MNYFKQFVSILLGLGLLLLSSSFLFKSNIKVGLSKEILSIDPDYSVKSLKMSQYDKNGHLSKTLVTPLLNHIPEKNIFDFVEPNMVNSKPKEQKIFISSSAGKAYFGGKKIVLTGNVIIRQPKDKNHPETLFKTDEVNYFPDQKYAETNKAVTFIQGLTQIHAYGAKTEFDSHNQIKNVIIKGNNKNQAHFWTQSKRNKELTHAYADMMYYYPEKNLIKLSGHAKVNQGKNEFFAEVIYYNTLLQQVDSQAGQEPIKMIFYPKDNILPN